MGCEAISFRQRFAGYAIRLSLSLSAACFAMCGLPFSYERTAVLATFIAPAVITWILTGISDKWRDLLLPFSKRRAVVLLLAVYSMARWAVGGLPGIDHYGVLLAWRIMSACSVPAVYMLYLVLFESALGIARNVIREAGPCTLLAAVFAACCMAVFTYIAISYPAWLSPDAPYRCSMPYAFDAGMALDQDAFFYPGVPINDSRNLFFGVLAMPVGAACHLAGDLSRLVSGVDVYAYALGAAQAAAAGLLVLMFACLLSDHALGRAAACCLFLPSWAVVMNTLVLEQYVFSMFWLGAFLYSRARGRDTLVPGVMMCGGILSSSALPAPMLAHKDSAAQVGKIYGCSVLLAVLTGMWRRLCLVSKESRSGYSLFFGSLAGLPFLDCLRQFLVFVRAVFVMPPSSVHNMPYIGAEGNEIYALFWAQDVPSGFDIAGIAILAVMAAGFLVSRNDRFSRTCAWWVGVSFFIMCAAGWGTVENSLVIYTLYFGWAYIGLVFRFLEWAARGRLRILAAACGVLGTIMAVADVQAFSRICSFLGRLGGS